MNNKKFSFATYPYVVWSALFIIVPLIIVLFFSLTISDADGYKFSFENFTRLLKSQYGLIFFRSIRLDFISKMAPSKRNLIIMLFIVPMWMNFLLRTYAWLPILGKNGFINNILGHFGIGPLSLLYNDGTVLLGMVYNFLPFMVLPIYTVLSKMDESLIAAAEDLGANKAQIFKKIIIPLSVPGIMSGITMVFMPAVSTFVISSLLGGGKYMLLGNLIEQEFTTIGDWNFGSAISIIMMIVILF